MTPSTIDVGAIWSRLKGPYDQTALIKETLTLDSPGAAYLRWGDGKTRFLKVGDTFLAGLTWRVIRALVDGGFPKPVVRWPLVMEKRPLTPTPISVRPEDQEPAIEKMIRARRLGLEHPTGGGKTRIGIEAARRIGHRTLWLTHTKDLLSQTVERFEELLDIECGVLGAGKDIPGDGRVVVAMTQTLGRMLDEKRGAPEIVKPYLAEFGCVIADEGHHASADSWQEILMQCTSAQYRFALSATLGAIPEPVNQFKIEGAFGPTWRTTSVSGLADLGFLAKPRMIVLCPPSTSYPTYEDIRDFICPTWRENPRQLRTLGALMFKEMYERGIVENDSRNQLLLEVICRHVAQNEKVLVLCSRVPHMELLWSALNARLGQAPVWGMDGNAPDRPRTLAQFRRAEGAAVLIATPFAREGIDLPQVDVGVMAGGGLSDTAVMQGLGRMLRKRPGKDEVLIYDCRDGGNTGTEREDKDWLGNHWGSRFALYDAQGFTIEEWRG
jgi:superfamily II DNA or RNA helicase